MRDTEKTGEDEYVFIIFLHYISFVLACVFIRRMLFLKDEIHIAFYYTIDRYGRSP